MNKEKIVYIKQLNKNKYPFSAPYNPPNNFPEYPFGDKELDRSNYEHYWLNTLEKEKQEEEIDKSIKFLKEIGCNLDKWVMCYPYGGYDSSLLDILQYRGCN